MACTDTIRVADLQVTVPLRSGARWPKDPPEPVSQPLLLTLDIFHDIRQTAATDDLAHSINYSALAKTLKSTLESHGPFDSLENIIYTALDALLADKVRHLRLSVTQTRPPLHVESIRVQIEATGLPGSWKAVQQMYFFDGLQCDLIIGVNNYEREDKQKVQLDFSIDTLSQDLSRHFNLDMRTLLRCLHTVSAAEDLFQYLVLIRHAVFIAIHVLDSRSTCLPRCN